LYVRPILIIHFYGTTLTKWFFFSLIVDPQNDPHARGDPYKVLFVARLSYDVKESDLEREFGRFGPIERVRHGSLV
jgi:RNA recognition motif-containing protein